MILWTDELQRAVTYTGVGVLAALIVAVGYRLVVYSIVQRTNTDLDDILARRLRGPLALSCLASGLWYGAAELSLPAPYPWLLGGGLATAVVMLWTISLSATSHELLDWLAHHRDRYATLVTDRTWPVFDIAAKTVIWGGGIYFVFLAWSVDLTGWLASAGIVGVAVGFASKDTLSNLIAGVFILADAPYKLGDYLVVDGSQRGEVVEIGIRTTRLKTRDDVEIIVPNAVMANSRIVNQSGGGDRSFRIRIKVGVAYGSDVDAVRDILEEIAFAEPLMRESPAPRCRLRELGDSSLNYELMGWVDDPSLRGRCTDQVLAAIYKRLMAEGIEIPYPKRDVIISYAEALPEPGDEGPATAAG